MLPDKGALPDTHDEDVFHPSPKTDNLADAPITDSSDQFDFDDFMKKQWGGDLEVPYNVLY